METALPEEVADRMKKLLSEYNNKEEKTFDDILDFRANLKYPTVNELWNYCWKITNEVNDDTFLSFDDFDKAAYKNVSGREEFLQHLSLYKKEISFQFKKGAMFVFWKNKNGLKLSLI